MKDFLERMTSYKTTIIGFVTLVVSVLTGLNVNGPDAGAVLAAGVDLLYGNVVELLGSITGLILIFSKD